jgi:hypothetical protein
MGYKLTKAEILEKAGKLKTDDGGRSLSLAAVTKLDTKDVEDYLASKGGDTYLDRIFTQGMNKIKKDVAAGKVKAADVTPERVVATGLSLEEYRNYRGRLSKFISKYGKYDAGKDTTPVQKPEPQKVESPKPPEPETRETEQSRKNRIVVEKTEKVIEKLKTTTLQAEGQGETVESAFRAAAQEILNQLEQVCGEKRRMSPGEVIGYFHDVKIPRDKIGLGKMLGHVRIDAGIRKIDDKYIVNISVPLGGEPALVVSYLSHSPWDAGHKKVRREAIAPAAAPKSDAERGAEADARIRELVEKLPKSWKVEESGVAAKDVNSTQEVRDTTEKAALLKIKEDLRRALGGNYEHVPAGRLEGIIKGDRCISERVEKPNENMSYIYITISIPNDLKATLVNEYLRHQPK